MTPTEAAALLTICAAYDNRKPDPDAAKAWAMALDSYRFEDCRAAIVTHYRTSREWIMPADVITAVKRTRTGRLEDAAPCPPAGLDPDDTSAYTRWLRGVRRAIADGCEVHVEDYPATRAIGELRHVLRDVSAIAAIAVRPRAGTAEHEAALERARAELPPPAPMPDDSEAAE
jgi:hypothetical protein